jgi:type IV pilus assembly protein PilQ
MYRLIILISAVILISLPLINVHAQDSESNMEEATPEKLNLNFENIDIRHVLKLIALKGNVNIVAGPEVSVEVSINLKGVMWHEALDILLATYGYGYDIVGNAIIVEPIEKLSAKRKAEKELTDVQLTVTKVFTMKYVDANDMKFVIEPQLSPKGTVTVLQETSRGWDFAGGGNVEKREQTTTSKLRSDKLVVTDIPPYLNKIKQVINELDVKPRQILIQAKIIEVNRDFLRDIGFDWGTGSTGARDSTITTVGMDNDRIGGQILESQVTPSSFGPEATAITGVYPYNAGLSLIFQKLSGTQFEVIFHALEENVDTNILSAPHIVTVDGREATILVGTKYPILKADITGTDTTTVTATLDYYQDIGIQLNVLPKIAEDDSINIVIHPAITDFTETLKARGSANQIIAEYPIIQTREAETSVFINNGETIVIGGLLKDVERYSEESVPLLSKIPILGYLFKRQTKDTEKIDLLLFITVHIIEDSQQLSGIIKESSEITYEGFEDDATDD